MLNDFLFHFKAILELAAGAEFDTFLFYEFSLLSAFLSSIVCRLATMLFFGEGRGYPVIWITTAFLLFALFSAGAASSAWVDPHVASISVQSAICCILFCCAFASVIPVAKFLLGLRTIEAGAFLLFMSFTIFIANLGVRYAHEKNYDRMAANTFLQMLTDLQNALPRAAPPAGKQ